MAQDSDILRVQRRYLKKSPGATPGSRIILRRGPAGAAGRRRGMQMPDKTTWESFFEAFESAEYPPQESPAGGRARYGRVRACCTAPVGGPVGYARGSGSEEELDQHLSGAGWRGSLKAQVSVGARTRRCVEERA
jgi:hypothetical protein